MPEPNYPERIRLVEHALSGPDASRIVSGSAPMMATSRPRSSGERAPNGLRRRFPLLAASMEETEHDVLAHRAYPKDHWARIALSISHCRMNKQTRHRSQKIRTVTDDAAMNRILGPLYAAQSNE
jgi:transposase-like protein